MVNPKLNTVNLRRSTVNLNKDINNRMTLNAEILNPKIRILHRANIPPNPASPARHKIVESLAVLSWEV
jgi:hypothetical protein